MLPEGFAGDLCGLAEKRLGDPLAPALSVLARLGGDGRTSLLLRLVPAPALVLVLVLVLVAPLASSLSARTDADARIACGADLDAVANMASIDPRPPFATTASGFQPFTSRSPAPVSVASTSPIRVRAFLGALASWSFRKNKNCFRPRRCLSAIRTAASLS
jgi:hypothetical protein